MAELALPYVLALVTNNRGQILFSHRSSTQWFANHYGLVGGKIKNKERIYFKTDTIFRG
jgi:hypothetical protein